MLRRSFKNLLQRSFSIQSPTLTIAARTMSETITSPKDKTEKEYHSRIYTKTGDKGTSTLYNMQRIPKTADYFDALGNTDELNATIGLAREYCLLEGNGIEPQLEEIQSNLLDAGASIATPLNASPEFRIARTPFAEEHVAQLEVWIDAMDQQLPPIKQFVLPSGGLASSTLHIARTICRRAERSVVPLVEREDLDPVVMRYLNRLSDYMFVAARFAAMKAGKAEVLYLTPTQRAQRNKPQPTEQ